ncbi:MAG: sulfite exporter TauE/SafE family protein [Solirubrobacterales bacterium]
MAELLTALFALIGGAIGGVLGVGGGIVFVPALAIILGEPQLQAEATSLLAIVPVAIVGTWRQHRHGNVRVRDGLLIGVLAVPGVVIGVIVANAVSERALELGFAGLMLFVASQLIRRALRGEKPSPAPPADSS